MKKEISWLAGILEPLTRYLTIGLVNTMFTVTIIFFLTSLGFGVYSANAIGYMAGITLSFALNSYFTFSIKMNATRLIKFSITAIVCYLINIVAIKTLLCFIPGGKYVAQILGMTLYTLSGFILNKAWAMK
ncbi:hypothetical protein BTN33_18155 [Aeromonas veronii]|uniref:GtrA family protein n=1 Tax=Aeromonas veronii TaxID=654 RepID=UPI000946EF70|nr:GtrA family protein [Aeromonas veronii]OLF57800.1 hypothetical protein BTN33_18155 [Aeromonas veronii]